MWSSIPGGYYTDDPNDFVAFQQYYQNQGGNMLWEEMSNHIESRPNFSIRLNEILVNSTQNYYNGSWVPEAESQVAYYSSRLSSQQENKGIERSNFLSENWKDVAFMANDLAQAYVKVGTTFKISAGYNLSNTTVRLPFGLTARMSTKAVGVVANSGKFIANAAPWVAAGGIAYGLLAERQFTAGDLYQSIVTGASVVPGWGLVVGGGALALEGTSYYFTGKSVSHIVNRQLNGGVIISW
ncbi:hypothetical protein KO02_09455 [Sphingobacterium sp. ML3W]|nr:hypothetical protein KO02_09455 [Sphingobacterium sp. ML3W]